MKYSLYFHFKATVAAVRGDDFNEAAKAALMSL